MAVPTVRRQAKHTLSKLASALRRWANRRNRKICFVISRVPLIKVATHFMTKLITFAQGDHERASGLGRLSQVWPFSTYCRGSAFLYVFEIAAIEHCAAQPKMQLHEDVDGIYPNGFTQGNRRAGPCSRICRQQPRGRADSRRHGKRLAMKHDRSRVSRWESSNRR
jgi:hypothetical protein